MNVEALRKLSVDQLKFLSETISAELERRVTASIAAGRDMKFFSSRLAREVYIRVTRINGASVSGFEIDPETRQLTRMKWRVAKQLLTPA